MRLMSLGGDSMDEVDRMATLMITHKLEVMQMCDRVLAVDQGEIVVDGSIETADAVWALGELLLHFFCVLTILNTTYRYTRCLKGTGWLITAETNANLDVCCSSSHFTAVKSLNSAFSCSCSYLSWIAHVSADGRNVEYGCVFGYFLIATKGFQ